MKMGFCTAIAFIVSLSAALTAQTTEGPRVFSGSNSTQVVNVQQAGSGYGIKASTPSTSSVAGVYGKASAASGFTNGVWGVASSTKGVGVRGQATSTGTGVVGSASGNSGAGVYGSACLSNSLGCNGVGVWGVVNGINVGSGAAAGRFEIAGADSFPHSLLLGLFDGTPEFRVDGSGQVFANGGFTTGGADFAESFDVKGRKSLYSPGDVLVIDQTGNRRVSLSQEPYSTRVAGIYSTKPGVTASPYPVASLEQPRSDVPMAVVGVVPTKVSAENGAIQPGDLLVTATSFGYAMKGTDRGRMTGAVVGKALQPLSNGKGVIQVLVTLQ